MDGTTGGGGFSPYFNHPAAGNGLFSAPSSASGEGAPPLLFPGSVGGRPSAAPAPAPVTLASEPVKRKRGRPRKYGSFPSSPPSVSTSASPVVRNASQGLGTSALESSARKKQASASKKAQLEALGNPGQGFIPHVIGIAAGEDVAQKIMSFTQQHKRAVCILSASGSISSVTLRQSAMSGGNVTYEGRFEILSLSGSFLHVETDGASSRTGGLSVSLSGTNGHIVGGGIGGPLTAAGPVQVIAGSFLIDPDKDSGTSMKVDNSASKLSTASLAGTTNVSPVSFRSTADSIGRIPASGGSDDHQSVGGIGSSYFFQSQGIHFMPSRFTTDWRGQRQDTGQSAAGQSPEEEDE